MAVNFCKFCYNGSMDKQSLRKKAKEIRRGLDIEALSAGFVAQIREMPEFQRAKNVLLYYPLEYELNLLGLCDCEKSFYLPRIDGENLLICPFECRIRQRSRVRLAVQRGGKRRRTAFECGCELRKSAFKTLEPCSEPVEPEVIDFAIIPCLMADKRGFRLGYGGGFYDRFIPSLREDCVKIAAVPQELFVDELPVEKFDYRVDLVVNL